MRFACADYAFPLLSHEQIFDLLASLAIPAVDIALFDDRSHIQHADVLPDPAAAARELCGKLDARGLVAADVFHQSGPDLETLAENQPDPERRLQARDLFQRTLEFVVLCGARHMTALPGIHWPEEPYEASLERAAEEHAWRVEQAAKSNVVYAVEPHMWSIVKTPEQTARLLDMTPGLTLSLDFAHFTAQDIPDDHVLPLLQHTSHIHARCAAPGLVQCSLANNTIDWEGVVRASARAGYSGYFALEYVVMEHESVADVDNISETIRLRDLLRNCDEAELL